MTQNPHKDEEFLNTSAKIHKGLTIQARLAVQGLAGFFEGLGLRVLSGVPGLYP